MHCISSVKIGVLGQHSPAQLLQNLSTALPHVVENIRENWDNVQSIHIKTSSSASLPIWSCRLDDKEGGRWDGLTRIPIPDDRNGEAKKRKMLTLESEEGPEKKKKKPDTPTEKFVSTSQASRPDPPPTGPTPSKGSKPIHSATFTEPSKGLKRKPAPGSSTKISTNTEVKQKPARRAAVDFFDSDDIGDQPSPSKTSASKMPTLQKLVKSNPLPTSKDSTSKGEKHPKTKTILKSSKKATGSTTASVPAKEKHVKFAAKLSDSKTKRDKALSATGKKVRSGGGRSVSAKDGILRRKVAVK